MADERSVDVDDSRDSPGAAGRGRAPIAAAGSRLSPVQEAWSAYVDHSLRRCDTCRAADGTPCDTAEELYRAYRVLSADAAARLREA
jgi:hypothetical protein